MITVKQRWQHSWQVVLVLLMLGSICCPPLPLIAQPLEPERLAHLRHSVVRVLGDRKNNPGSGILIKVEGYKGYILTAHHVIQSDIDAGRVSVQVALYSDPERPVEARLSYDCVDTKNDVAILIINHLPEPPPAAIPWDSATALRETQRVYALGHPTSTTIGWSVTEGTVSGKNRGSVYFSGPAASPGYSGGPLLNEQGAFVAMILSKGGQFGEALAWEVIRLLISDCVKGLADPPPKPGLPPKPPLAPIIHGKDGKEMLLVPAGWFAMGHTEVESAEVFESTKPYNEDITMDWFIDAIPRHRVWLDAFYMDRYEVTVGEYKAFLKATGGQALPKLIAKYAPQDSHPVVLINWEEAEAYCRWADKQLPTEAQWEKAARGTNERQYPWGNEAADGRRANYCDTRCDQTLKDQGHNDGSYTARVGSYPLGKSTYGIEDLAGNVWEWVQDWYDDTYYRNSPEHNPANVTPRVFRVLRGGGWFSDPIKLRATFRRRAAPVTRDSEVGFRCVGMKKG